MQNWSNLHKIQYNDPQFLEGRQPKFKVTNIDHTHPIDGVDIKPHTHLGFIHFENGTRNVTSQVQKDINKMEAIWNGLKI